MVSADIGDTELDRLSFIRHARQLGFTLEANRELLDLSDQPASPALPGEPTPLPGGS